MGLVTTLADLTADKLVAYYPIAAFGPLRSGTPLQQPSTDPNVYMSDPNYQKYMNEQAAWDQCVDQKNIYARDRFRFVAQQWERNKTATNIPKPIAPWLPAGIAFLRFDVPAFDQWWSMYAAAPGVDAPPQFFVKPLYPLDANGNPTGMPADPIIVAATPTIVLGDGPVGPAAPANQRTYYQSSSDDTDDLYPDMSVYEGETGTFQKHIYQTPFGDPAKNYEKIVWLRIGPAMRPASGGWTPVMFGTLSPKATSSAASFPGPAAQ